MNRSRLARSLCACLGALLTVLAAACSPSGARRPNLVLVTLDTTRADRLGCYGYDRPTTPRIDQLAEDSVVYTNAYSVSSWTMPTHASMFTGKYPSAHGARYDPKGKLRLTQGIQGQFDHYRAQPIADDEVTLAALLAMRGWKTGGVAGGPWMKKVFRLDRGFDFYDDDNIDEVNGRSAEDLTRAAKEFVDRNAKRPFFLFLNYYDPHSPYRPSTESVRRVMRPGEDPNSWTQTDQMNIAYDAEIRYMDEHFGDFLDHLRAKGLYENTWIIVTADHGELMGDHILDGGEAFGHGHSLSEAEIKIPMIVKYPGADAPTGRREDLVQQTDILPTVLETLGLPLPPNVQGEVFGKRTGRVFAEVYPLPVMNLNPKRTDWRLRGDWQVILDGSYKFGKNSFGRDFLVDLQADPQERANVLDAHPEKGGEMGRMIRDFLDSLPKPGEASAGRVDASTQSALKHLGYTGDEDEENDGEAKQDEGK